MAGPLLERQLAPIPEPPPISEERLQEKGKRVCPHFPGSYSFMHTCLQQRNGNSYSQNGTARRESLGLWRLKKKTCHQNM